MWSLSNWFRENKSNSQKEVSLFKIIPFTYIICTFFGVSLSTHSKIHHRVTHFVFSLLRILCLYSFVRPEIYPGNAMKVINQTLFYLVGLIFYWLFIGRRKAIVTFLLSNASAISKMKSINILHPLLVLVPHLLTGMFFFFSSVRDYQKNLFGPISECCPSFALVLFYVIFSVGSLLFQPTLCMVMYVLGYCVLYTEKSSVLTSIGRNWKSVEYDVIVRQLKSVSDKQEHFECIFGPFLFICLYQIFSSTVQLIYLIRALLLYRSLICFAASILLTQVSCVGLIFYVCICNDRLKSQAASISFQMEEQLVGHSATTLLLISKLQRRISETINEPLTAWKMMTVDRQIVLSIAASCVSFSVLYIQINNGALSSK